MENIKERIKNVMSAVFEIPASDITENSSFDDIENWDSLRHLNLILGLEEEFNITIPDDEVVNLLNFKLIELTVNEQTK
ncbi:MAG: phosphopantetheine-binding protein [Ferruginibacter sp.]